jgi:hypothetical protein
MATERSTSIGWPETLLGNRSIGDTSHSMISPVKTRYLISSDDNFSCKQIRHD